MPAFEIKKRKLWIFEHYQFEYLLGLFDDHLGDVIDAALPNYSLRSLTTCVMDNTISVNFRQNTKIKRIIFCSNATVKFTNYLDYDHVVTTVSICGFKHTSCLFRCRLIICCRTYVCNRENLFKSVKPLCDGKLLEFWLCSCKNPLYLNLLFWLWHLSFITKFLLFCSERCLINRPLFVNNQQHEFQTTTKTRVK